jgi:hypothetical protein
MTVILVGQSISPGREWVGCVARGRSWLWLTVAMALVLIWEVSGRLCRVLVGRNRRPMTGIDHRRLD